MCSTIEAPYLSPIRGSRNKNDKKCFQNECYVLSHATEIMQMYIFTRVENQLVYLLFMNGGFSTLTLCILTLMLVKGVYAAPTIWIINHTNL